MSFKWKDNVIYDDLWDVVISGAAVTAETAAVIQDVFGFYLTDGAIGDEVAFVYRCRQVLATKKTGTGEAILRGDRVYYYPADDAISSTATGTAGTDYYFCGWAKKSALATDSTVLINFDGTRYDETI